MDDPVVERSRALRRRVGRRLWILVGGLIALSLAYVGVSLSPRFLSGQEGEGRPLDRCLTEQAVLEFLDGKTTDPIEPMDGATSGVRSLTLRKERISSLTIRSGDYPAIQVRFNLEDQGRRYAVEGQFIFTTVDEPRLHQHHWDGFMGQVISSR